MNTFECKDCEFFRQHYILRGERYSPAGCGHCVAVRMRYRKANKKACDEFKVKETKVLGTESENDTLVAES